MTYLHSSMGGELPPEDDLGKIIDVIATNDDAPILVHCAGSNRVGAIWSYFPGTRGGLTGKAAIAEGKAAGMRSESLEEEVGQVLAH